jgi:hypothetical protein
MDCTAEVQAAIHKGSVQMDNTETIGKSALATLTHAARGNIARDNLLKANALSAVTTQYPANDPHFGHPGGSPGTPAVSHMPPYPTPQTRAFMALVSEVGVDVVDRWLSDLKNKTQ